ncbi:hypothetical protein STRNTR1_1603 [Stenotrophomonas maltophilia]|nr:hypothetical protein STRNTR1_1603 [Stenotrophomonas maltophilia]
MCNNRAAPLRGSIHAHTRQGKAVSIIFKVMDPEARTELIRDLTEEAIAKRQYQKEFKFRAGMELPVIAVPIELPVYRLENYRTRDQQLTLIAKREKEDGLFDVSNTENPESQLAQHAILLKQSKDGSGETIKPIHQELGRVGQQTENLIISATGIVVNGNRRLAAMRDLRGQRSEGSDPFKYVNCMVLPASATPREIRELEIALQMQPETKLPYNWTALGRAVRDMLDANYSYEEIERQTNRSRSELDRAAAMVTAAELYLASWLEKPQDFSKLDDTEQAFAQVVVRNYAKQDDAQLREATRKFDFFVIEHRDFISDSAYKLINAIESNPEIFLTNMAKELDVDLAPLQDASEEVLEIDFGVGADGVAPVSYDALIDSLMVGRGDEVRAKQLISTIEEVAFAAVEQGRARDKAALKLVQAAERKLSQVDINSAGTDTYAEILDLLDRCVARIESIRNEIGLQKRAGGTH